MTGEAPPPYPGRLASRGRWELGTIICCAPCVCVCVCVCLSVCLQACAALQSLMRSSLRQHTGETTEVPGG